MPGRYMDASDPSIRDAQHLRPRTYADAIEYAPGHFLADSSSDIDEELIKETPPRPSSDHSVPRPLGEMLDEDEEQRSPRPVTPSPAYRKSTPGLSYADAAAQNGHSRENSGHSVDHDSDRQSIHSDASVRSPLRRMNRRIPSETLDGGSRKAPESLSSSLIFENIDGSTGEHLVTVKPSEGSELALREDKTVHEKEELRKYSKDNLVSGRRAGAGWGNSAIRWAPLNIPLQRRLQTLMVLVHTLCIVALVTLFFFLCAIPILWPVLFPYTIYILFSKAGISGQLSYRSERLRRSPIWSLFAGYFPARLHRTTELPPTRKYIFGYHPHGIISHGAFTAFATEALGFSQLFPGITNTLLTLDSNFRIPLYRDYALFLGLGSVSRESCVNLLSKGGHNGEGMGRAITIVIGGARESLDAQPDSLRLVLRTRKGFVKMAIRTGADLVPVLAFGENELYEQVSQESHPRLHKAQLVMKRLLGFTVPLFHARGIFNYDVGLLPYRRPLNIVVGRPIKVDQQKEPEPAYVDEVHERYIEELLGIHKEWKNIFGHGTELQIID